MTEFVELPKETFDVPIKIVNQEKLKLDINDFLNNDIIIINSGTATGKTRIVGKHSKQLKEDENYILSSQYLQNESGYKTDWADNICNEF